MAIESQTEKLTEDDRRQIRLYYRLKDLNNKQAPSWQEERIITVRSNPFAPPQQQKVTETRSLTYVDLDRLRARARFIVWKTLAETNENGKIFADYVFRRESIPLTEENRERLVEIDKYIESVPETL